MLLAVTLSNSVLPADTEHAAQSGAHKLSAPSSSESDVTFADIKVNVVKGQKLAT